MIKDSLDQPKPPTKAIPLPLYLNRAMDSNLLFQVLLADLPHILQLDLLVITLLEENIRELDLSVKEKIISLALILVKILLSHHKDLLLLPVERLLTRINLHNMSHLQLLLLRENFSKMKCKNFSLIIWALSQKRFRLMSNKKLQLKSLLRSNHMKIDWKER